MVQGYFWSTAWVYESSFTGTCIYISFTYHLGLLVCHVRTELSSCDGNHMVCQVENIYYSDLSQKSLLTLSNNGLSFRIPGDYSRPSHAKTLINGGFPGGTSGKEPSCQCRRHKRLRFDPSSERSHGGGHDNPLQDSCQENPMDRETWQARERTVAQSWTWLKKLSTH